MAWVTEPGVQVLLGFFDDSGHRATLQCYMDSSETDPTGGGPAALAAAAQDISDCAVSLVECRIRASESAPGVPSDGPYARGADKAQFGFKAADGSPVKLQIGAPNETVFQADKINVDPADSAVVALVAAMKLYGKTAEGVAISTLTTSYRKRNSGRKGL